jgi:hypothetical protein
MSKTPYTQQELDALKVVTQPHRLHPDYHTDNFFAIATAEGQSDLEKKARDGFREMDSLPDYVYVPETKQLPVGDKIVNYALVCGVYSR